MQESNIPPESEAGTTEPPPAVASDMPSDLPSDVQMEVRPEAQSEMPPAAESVAQLVAPSELQVVTGQPDADEATNLPAAADSEEISDLAQIPNSPEISPAVPLFPLTAVVEAILFTSQKPVSARELLQFLRSAAAMYPEDPSVKVLARTKEPALRGAVEQLNAAYSQSGRSFEIRETATGWQMVTRPDFAPWLRQLFPENRPARLSAPALETLAIIAYRQPITRADIEAVRGVAVDGVMQTLLDRGLIKISGRADVPGRPLLYSTTSYFMEHFGLRDLAELPNAGELRNRPLPTAPTANPPTEAPPAQNPATPDSSQTAMSASGPIGAAEPSNEPASQS